MRYTVELAPAAQRQLRKLPSKVQERIVERLGRLEENPRPPGVEKLTGVDGLLRIRVGDYRVIYQVEDLVLRVLVLKVGDRKAVYRNL